MTRSGLRVTRDLVCRISPCANATIGSAPKGKFTMARATAAASVLMFGVPFLLLAACYAALPVEVPVLLNPIAGAIIRDRSRSSRSSASP